MSAVLKGFHNCDDSNCEWRSFRDTRRVVRGLRRAMEKILVIEDNKDYQFLIQSALGTDFKVTCADTGKNGVEMSRDLKPDLILLDISLGEMDGFEVCHLLRGQKETAN